MALLQMLEELKPATPGGWDALPPSYAAGGGCVRPGEGGRWKLTSTACTGAVWTVGDVLRGDAADGWIYEATTEHRLWPSRLEVKLVLRRKEGPVAEAEVVARLRTAFVDGLVAPAAVIVSDHLLPSGVRVTAIVTAPREGSLPSPVQREEAMRLTTAAFITVSRVWHATRLLHGDIRAGAFEVSDSGLMAASHRAFVRCGQTVLPPSLVMVLSVTGEPPAPCWGLCAFGLAVMALRLTGCRHPLPTNMKAALADHPPFFSRWVATLAGWDGVRLALPMTAAAAAATCMAKPRAMSPPVRLHHLRTEHQVAAALGIAGCGVQPLPPPPPPVGWTSENSATAASVWAALEQGTATLFHSGGTERVYGVVVDSDVLMLGMHRGGAAAVWQDNAGRLVVNGGGAPAAAGAYLMVGKKIILF